MSTKNILEFPDKISRLIYKWTKVLSDTSFEETIGLEKEFDLLPNNIQNEIWDQIIYDLTN